MVVDVVAGVILGMVEVKDLMVVSNINHKTRMKQEGEERGSS
jgi:hypothetical protein